MANELVSGWQAHPLRTRQYAEPGTKHLARAYCSHPFRLALKQRQLPEVLTIQEQEIEDMVSQGAALRAAIHQPFKSGMARFVQRDNLAVEHRCSLQALELVCDCGESFVERVVPSRIQLHAADQFSDGAKPIPLDFKNCPSFTQQ
jgi:hypothetical protein